MARSDAATNGEAGVQPVAAVQRALRILQCFNADELELGVTEVAAAVGLHKATAHRLLATLESEGFLRRTDGKKYRLGLCAYQLGLLASPDLEERRAIQEELGRLATATGETAHFAILDGSQVLYVEKVEGSHRLRMPSAVGRRVPAHCTALGKVILASMTEHERLQVLAELGWERYTNNTFTEPSAFLAELESVRVQGVAFDRQEFEEGLSCIGTAVPSDSGSVVGAVSISGPSTRFDTYADRYIAELTETAAAIGAQAPGYLHWLEASAGSPARSVAGLR